jgi:hypothetical protein
MFDEDLKVFFDTKGFASNATFTLPGGLEHHFPVIFDNAFINPETGLFSLESTNPQGSCRQTDVDELIDKVAAANGGSAVLPNGQGVPLRSMPAAIDKTPRGQTFAVLEVKPDGEGTCTIQFSRES